MDINYRGKAEQLNKKHKYRAVWYRIVSVLSCIVVFCTVYALILPAITLESTSDTYCGYAYEHTHDIVACYEIPGILEHTEIVCTAKAELHSHTEACYTATGELDCGYADFLIHTHDDSCYDENDELVCTLKEVKVHTHVATCWIEQTVAVCGEEHVHSDACYATKRTLICGKQEIIAHTHSAACFENGELVCEMTEIKAHSHTELCNKVHIDAVEPQNLICGKIAHTHTTRCFVCADEADKELSFASCTCGSSVSALAEHSDSCVYKQSVNAYAESSTSARLYKTWSLLSSDEQSYVLDYLSKNDAFAQKLIDIKYYLENGPEVTVTASYENGITVSVSGELLPLNTRVEITSPAHLRDRVYDFFNPNIINDIHSYYIYDICLTCDGEIYKLAEGARVEVTVSELDLTVTTDELFGVAHLDETTGKILSNEYVELLGGTATFEADGFSPYVFYTVSREIYGGERNWGTNWITLRDNGWYDYWEQFLPNGENAEAYESSSSASYTSSDNQITAQGGYVKNPNNDGVSVGKTIASTALENIFDITLTIETTTDIKQVTLDPDMAVVIVLDISNTMLEDYGSVTKYSSAMEAAEAFVWNYAAGTKGISKLGFVAFNTNATQICSMQNITTDNAAAFCNTMRKQTGSIINADGYGSSSIRYTNMEAGLKMAQNMLAQVNNKNQYVIFLTDGLPTTYVRSGYTGYEPKSTSGTEDRDGVFYDRINKKYCQYGVNYSDKAATKAETVAKSMKDSGITIYSVGMAVDGFTATHGNTSIVLNSSDFIKDQLARGANAKVTYSNGTSYTYSGYAVSTIDNYRKTTYAAWDGTMTIGNVKTSTSAFNNWLKGSDKSGIASGYYYNAANSKALTDAFDAIFSELSQKIQETFASLWVTKDMIPIISENGCIEFISFIDGNTLKGNSLSGKYEENGKNTAEFNVDTSTIIWDLKKSGYTTTVSGSTTVYKYSIVYRVRLINDDADFVEGDNYITNGDAYLSYNTVKTTDGVSVISDVKQIYFPVPSVKGYLVDFGFKKLNGLGQVLSGAGFTLMHDTEGCAVCHGDGKCTSMPQYTAVSDKNGMVYFKDIPSGHKYILLETDVPDGYRVDGNTYHVTAAYDEITVAVYRNGKPVTTWSMDGNDTITNVEGYELPSTGGNGTERFAVMGMTVMLGACIIGLIFRRKHKLYE